MEDESRDDYLGITAQDEMESYAETLRRFAAALTKLAGLCSLEELSGMCERTAAMLGRRADKWERRAAEAESDETQDPEYEPDTSSGFDVAGLFSDL
jgi:hypothetical protein